MSVTAVEPTAPTRACVCTREREEKEEEEDAAREIEVSSALGATSPFVHFRLWHVRIRVQRCCVWSPAAFKRTEGSESVTMAEFGDNKSAVGPPVAGWRAASGGEPVSNGNCGVPDGVKRVQNESSCESPTWESTGSDSASKPIPRRSSLIKVGQQFRPIRGKTKICVLTVAPPE